MDTKKANVIGKKNDMPTQKVSGTYVPGPQKTTAKKKVQFVVLDPASQGLSEVCPEEKAAPSNNEWAEYNKEGVAVANGISSMTNEEFNARFPHFSRACKSGNWSIVVVVVAKRMKGMGLFTDREARELLKQGGDDDDDEWQGPLDQEDSVKHRCTPQSP